MGLSPTLKRSCCVNSLVDAYLQAQAQDILGQDQSPITIGRLGNISATICDFQRLRNSIRQPAIREPDVGPFSCSAYCSSKGVDVEVGREDVDAMGMEGIEGWTLLHIIPIVEKFEEAKLLILHGADVNKPTSTATHMFAGILPSIELHIESPNMSCPQTVPFARFLPLKSVPWPSLVICHKQY